jgi:hypothetical protein
MTDNCQPTVWHVLSDGEFQPILANAAHVKNVPGRKTDVSDAAWLAYKAPLAAPPVSFGEKSTILAAWCRNRPP